MARSQWVCDDVMRLILAAMMPANRLAIECSLVTGLRISDVLSLHTETIRKTQRPYVKDSKTGKTHRIYLPAELRQRLLQQAGTIWVFEGRSDARKHRTRSLSARRAWIEMTTQGCCDTLQISRSPQGERG